MCSISSTGAIELRNQGSSIAISTGISSPRLWCMDSHRNTVIMKRRTISIGRLAWNTAIWEHSGQNSFIKLILRTFRIPVETSLTLQPILPWSSPWWSFLAAESTKSKENSPTYTLWGLALTTTTIEAGRWPSRIKSEDRKRNMNAGSNSRREWSNDKRNS